MKEHTLMKVYEMRRQSASQIKTEGLLSAVAKFQDNNNLDERC